MSGDYETVKAWRARPENKAKLAAQVRRYRARHPEKVAAVKRAYRARHPERIKKQDADTIAKRKADPEGQRIRMARWRAKREETLAIIAGRPRPSVCDICHHNYGGIVFDHCHKSGEFRGWLCDRCNKVLGLMKDNPRLFRKMARYLEQASNGKIDDESAESHPLFGICIAGEESISD